MYSRVSTKETIKIGGAPTELRSRASIYRLLAGAFLEEPRADYLSALSHPDSLADLAQLGVQFDADITETDLEALTDALACEYTTLFVAPGGCPPVESVRLFGRTQQEPFQKVKRVYAQAGFSLQPGRFALFEDQLGVELLFVASMLERLAVSVEEDDEPASKQLEKEIKRFWALHLGRWVRGYAKLLASVTEHSFYREIANLLHDFAEEELALLGVRIDDIDCGKAVVPKVEIPLEFNPDEPICGACSAGESKAVA
ncbi:MAG: molecular chaperone TorD family protein [Alphaproteobacteria bacterium]